MLSGDSKLPSCNRVKHSTGEYVKIKASINGVAIFWALLKRGSYGTFHHFSVKHLNQYVSEFSTRHNTLFMGSDERFRYMIRISVEKRITYSELITLIKQRILLIQMYPLKIWYLHQWERNLLMRIKKVKLVLL
ncbi:MAG: hypothetical protein C4617_01195 [Candidatus Liberibacter europaeus]|uniref:ISXO2-like transposase domain-containing protein n=1 Tax=Candidatus Liberibacter europaeus TaxID=744859 RepID=A0A2T4VZ88_9HYPH|nr:hypothetical protein [Candidatus Liberibacter europaeus]PTL87099.1 MAG: hypothetical protein C4617_01195 [Candidatus Liberibacter europaeus]